MKTNSILYISASIIITLLFGAILAATNVSADDAVDKINITVPVSCTVSGTGMDTHNANINNGLYVPDIGTTTLHAFCNDNEGFVIYAAGYTGNEVGGANSNKLVGTNASNNTTIESGIATTAGNPDISNWAMKLAITQDSGDTTGTNAFTIDSAPNVDLPSEAESGTTQAPFSAYHVVPNEYTKVVHKNSATDMTTSTGGVKLTTTYAAYISKTQAADTYSGQVIYTLVHPSTAPAPVEPNQIGVLFHGNGQTFAGGKETNRVVYGDLYNQLYTAAIPEIIETSNLTNGEQNGSYTDSEYILETRTFNGASKIKVEVEYGITGDSFGMNIFNESWDGDWDNWKDIWNTYGAIWSSDDASGTKTFIIDGDTVTVCAESWSAPESGYDYGFSAKIYPIYTTEQENTIPLPTEYYASNTPEIIKTSNISDDGIQNGAYTDNEYILETRTFEGAAKVRVDVKFDITGDSAGMNVFNEPWDGDDDNWKDDWNNYGWIWDNDDISGTRSFIIEGDTVTIYAQAWNTPVSGHDYGFYVQVYPLYETERENTTPDNLIKSFGTQIGSYAETTNSNGYWYIESDNGKIFLADESEVVEYVEQNRQSLTGTTIDVYAYVGLVMQNVTEWKNDLIMEQQVEALDIRDGKTYMVAKLADGNVWMTQNLDLDLDSTITYTNEDTDIGYNATTGEYDSATWRPIRSTYTATPIYISDWCNGGEIEYYGCNNLTPDSYDLGDLYWDGTINDDNNSVNHIANEGIRQNHLGNYYNSTAAMALNDSNALGTAYQLVEQSICPAGWTLPRAGDGQDTFKALLMQYGWVDEDTPVNVVDDFAGAPLYFASSGELTKDSLQNVGYSGGFWSSVMNSNGGIHIHYWMGNSKEILSFSFSLGNALPIRCVARPVSDTVSGDYLNPK